jgi:hypothetical protein
MQMTRYPIQFALLAMLLLSSMTCWAQSSASTQVGVNKVEVITGGKTPRNRPSGIRAQKRAHLSLEQLRVEHEKQLKAFAAADVNKDGVLSVKEKKTFKQLVGRKKQSKNQSQ